MYQRQAKGTPGFLRSNTPDPSLRRSYDGGLVDLSDKVSEPLLRRPVLEVECLFDNSTEVRHAVRQQGLDETRPVSETPLTPPTIQPERLSQEGCV